jgi:hypothetical protein
MFCSQAQNAAIRVDIKSKRDTLSARVDRTRADQAGDGFGQKNTSGSSVFGSAPEK